jgi:uncharacterized membrane protein YfcA
MKKMSKKWKFLIVGSVIIGGIFPTLIVSYLCLWLNVTPFNPYFILLCGVLICSIAILEEMKRKKETNYNPTGLNTLIFPMTGFIIGILYGVFVSIGIIIMKSCL